MRPYRAAAEECAHRRTVDDDDAGDAENNGGMGGPAVFRVEHYNLTSLHSGP